MKILGISEPDNTASACLVIDGNVVGAASEERFTRIKQQDGFPIHTINWLLKTHKLSVDDLDIIAIAKTSTKNEIKEYKKALRKTSWNIFKAPLDVVLLDFAVWNLRNIPMQAKQVRKYNSQIQSWLQHHDVPRSKVKHVDHHVAHVASAYYSSGHATALAVTADGQGLGKTLSISICKNNSIKRIKSVSLPHSLGNFYGIVTKACGFTPSRHEGKITGLAAYGKPSKKLQKMVNSLIYYKNGDIKSGYIYGHYFRIKAWIRKYGREDVSAAFQNRLEEVTTQFVEYYVKKTKLNHVVLAGGVFANVKLNQRIHEIPLVKSVFVYPFMGDGGLSVGASLLQTRKRSKISDVYLGPSYTPSQILKELKKSGLSYSKPKNVAKEVAKLLSKNKIVARFDGAMEFGPRALGNRTIMYGTHDPSVNDWLNKSLNRSEFMPFAPVTLAEHVKDCYINSAGAEHASQFMTITFDCTPGMKNDSPAVVHVDGTARPQVIHRKINPAYYDIVKEYHKITRVPSVVNTSFNMHGEPIVCSPKDAIQSFIAGKLDILILGPYIVKNK